MIRYTKGYLNKMEDLISETDYILRYEKGNFKPGYCIIRDRKVIIVNKYYPVDGKINCLLEIIREIDFDTSNLSDSNKKLFSDEYLLPLPN